MFSISSLLRTESNGLRTKDAVTVEAPAPASKRQQHDVGSAITFPNMKKRFIARQLTLLFIHVGIVAWSYWMAFQLRFDLAAPAYMVNLFWQTLPLVVGVKLVVFSLGGSLHGWWRHVTFADLAKLLQVATISAIIILGIDYFLLTSLQIPRASLLLDWGITILLIGGSRSTWRLVREHCRPALDSRETRRALLIGVDQGGEALVRQLHGNLQLNYRVIGFLHDNRAHHGTRLGGVPFLGGVDQAVAIAAKRRAREILVIADSLCGRRLRELMTDCRRAGLGVKIIPNLQDLLDSSHRLHVREVNVNDLLRREPVKMDTAAVSKLLQGYCVLITGAGGSIGGEICRQVAKYKPASMVLVERTENNLFQIEQELKRTQGDVTCHACICDICDRQRLETIFQRHKPHIVFHAAAHKHVPLMEHNAGEAVKNNIFGTKTIADVAHAFDVRQWVLISTDKAVNPTSVMGTTKELAERYVNALSVDSSTKFIQVRFGNVLGSEGSVVPIFQEQIRRGGPLTITHPEMKRYFMTVPEAAQLVLQAAALGQGGETFVLDMGEPVKIVDLAEDLVRLSGLTPRDIEMKFVGMRPGEKLNEEIYREDEPTQATSHPKIRVVRHVPRRMADVQAWIAELAPLLNAAEETVHNKLKEVAASCRNNGTVPNGDQYGAPEDLPIKKWVAAYHGNGNGNGNGYANGNGNGNGKSTAPNGTPSQRKTLWRRQ